MKKQINSIHSVRRRWRRQVRTRRWADRSWRGSLQPGCDDMSGPGLEASVSIMDNDESHERKCGLCQVQAEACPSAQTLPFDECRIALSRKTVYTSEPASEETSDPEA